MELAISQQGSEQPQIIELKIPGLTIGRSTDNDLPFPDDPWLSRYHVKFDFYQDAWFVRDMSSRNGTLVNFIGLRDRHRLQSGDRIQAGHLVIEVRDARSPMQNVLSAATSELSDELAEAQELQRSLTPANPKIEGYDIAGSTVIAGSVGGDYYDFLPYTSGRLSIVCSDCSGKGLQAAKTGATMRSGVQALSEAGPDPASALSLLNEICCDNFEVAKFATVFFSVLTPETGVLRYANAGHNAPWLIRSDGKVVQLPGHGIVVGLMRDTAYDLHEVEIAPGETLVIFSDGISEADREGEEFGESRIAAFVLTRLAESCAQLARSLSEEVLEWSQLLQPSDDLTVILVRRL